MDQKINKSHRKPSSGPAADRKKEKKGTLNKNAEKNNPKAFAPRSGRNAERLGRRNMDLAQKKLHVPQVDRSTEEPAPIIVAVVGPPGVSDLTLSLNILISFIIDWENHFDQISCKTVYEA